jgi:hypothetical protein
VHCHEFARPNKGMDPASVTVRKEPVGSCAWRDHGPFDIVPARGLVARGSLAGLLS